MSTPADSVAPVSPEGSDNPWNGGIRRWWKNINDWLKALSPPGSSVFDTGFINVEPTLAGMIGTIVYARSGKWVHVQIDLQGTLPTGAHVIGQIPSGIGPTRGRARGAVYMDGGYAGVAHVTAGGTLSVAQQTGASRLNPSATIVYKLD